MEIQIWSINGPNFVGQGMLRVGDQAARHGVIEHQQQDPFLGVPRSKSSSWGSYCSSCWEHHEVISTSHSSPTRWTKWKFMRLNSKKWGISSTIRMCKLANFIRFWRGIRSKPWIFSTDLATKSKSWRTGCRHNKSTTWTKSKSWRINSSSTRMHNSGMFSMPTSTKLKSYNPKSTRWGTWWVSRTSKLRRSSPRIKSKDNAPKLIPIISGWRSRRCDTNYSKMKPRINKKTITFNSISRRCIMWKSRGTFLIDHSLKVNNEHQHNSLLEEIHQLKSIIHSKNNEIEKIIIERAQQRDFQDGEC